MAFITQQQPKSVDTSVMDAARADSRDCPFCNGEGMVTVYAPGYDGNETQFDHTGFVYVARTSAHCRCRLGRFIRAQTKDDVRKRIPDIEAIAQGRSTWLVVDPTEEALENPSTANDPVDPKAFKSFWRTVRISRIAKPVPEE